MNKVIVKLLSKAVLLNLFGPKASLYLNIHCDI